MGASTSAVCWIAHFATGTIVRGGLFVVLNQHLPGNSQWMKGVLFGIGAWILMMIAVMPMAGTGFFGMKLGIMAPTMILVLHVIFGAVLGTVYPAERPVMALNPQVSSR